MSRARAIVASAAAALLLSACGGGDEDAGSPVGTNEGSDVIGGGDGAGAPGADGGAGESGASAEAYVDAVAADMTTDGFAGQPDELRCLAEAYVAIIGADQLTAAGITAQELVEADNPGSLGFEMGDAEVESFAAAFDGCGPALGEVLLTGIDAEIPEGLAACISDNVDPDPIVDYLASGIVRGYSYDREAAAEIGAHIVATCPDFARLGGG